MIVSITLLFKGPIRITSTSPISAWVLLVVLIGLVSAFGAVVEGRRFWIVWRLTELAGDKLREAMDVRLRALIRQVTNGFDGPDARWSNDVKTTVASSLVELDIRDTVSSQTYAKVRSFIHDHDASAIGLTGPRGSGKSTVMQQLRADQQLRCIAVRVAAPVFYSPTEFTRIIHADLSREVAGSRSSHITDGFHRARRQAAGSVGKAVFSLLVIVTLILLWYYDKARPAPPAILNVDLFGDVVVICLAVFLGFLAHKGWTVFRQGALLGGPPATARDLGRQQLQKLRWVTTTEASRTTKFSLASSSLQGEDKLTRSERELSHAEAVQDLREFVNQLVAMTGRAVLVCIDELDKIADAGVAVEAINGIKDLFHFPKTHFVVSVSTDALHSFAARGVPVRDVFDSSFDTVIKVSRLSFEESRVLISRRALHFPASAALFCYAWAGGHPRDLIRTARSCVEFRHDLVDKQQAPTVARLSSLVLTRDLREVIDAAVQKLASENSSGNDKTLKALVELTLKLDGGRYGLHSLAKDLGRSRFPREVTGSQESQQLVNALLPYARLAFLIQGLFTTPRTPLQWQNPGLLRAAEAVAQARASLDQPPDRLHYLVEQAKIACRAVLP